MTGSTPFETLARLGVFTLAACACGPAGGTGSGASEAESESTGTGTTDDGSTGTESTGGQDVPPDLPGVDPCEPAPTPGDERTVWVEEFDAGSGVIVADLLAGPNGDVFVVVNADIPAQPSVRIAAHAEADGMESWANTTPIDGLRLASAAALQPAGGFVVVGETGDAPTRPDAWVGRFDSAGVLDWDLTVDSPTTDEEEVSDAGLDVVVTPSGDIYVLGDSAWGDDVQQAGWIAAVESDGGAATLVWDDTDEDCRVPRSFGLADNGDFLMGWTGPQSAATSSQDGCAKRVSSGGELEWMAEVGFPNFDRVDLIVELDDSALMWAGLQADAIEWPAYRTSVGRISSDGDGEWSRVIGYCDGDGLTEVARYGEGLVIAEVLFKGVDDAVGADGVLRAVDADGETQWLEALPNLGSGPPTQLVVSPSGSVFVAGRPDDATNDYFLARLDP